MIERCLKSRTVATLFAGITLCMIFATAATGQSTDTPPASAGVLKPVKKRVAGDPYFSPSLNRPGAEQRVKTGNGIYPLRSSETAGYLSGARKPTENLQSVSPGGEFNRPNGGTESQTIIRETTTPGNASKDDNSFQLPGSDSGNRSGSGMGIGTVANTGGAGIMFPEPPNAIRGVNSVESLGSLDVMKLPVTTADYESFEPGQVLAVVGGEPIFLGDVLFEVNTLIEEVLPTAPEKVKTEARAAFVKRYLPKYIDSTMLYVSTIRGLPEGADVENILEQAGKEFDEKALPEMIEKQGVGTRALFDASLRMKGSSLRQKRVSWSKEQLTRYFLSQQLNLDGEVSHLELLNYYNEHASEFDVVAKAKWEQVMVRFDRFPVRAEAKKAIVEMGNQIVYGAKLPAVAKRASHGYSAAEGGSNDWTTRGSLALEKLDEAIFTLPVGELSDIIETKDGFHIVRVKERTAAIRTPFLEAQVEIRETLQSRKREAAYQKHLAKIRREIPVKIFDDVLESKPKAGNFTLGEMIVTPGK